MKGFIRFCQKLHFSTFAVVVPTILMSNFIAHTRGGEIIHAEIQSEAIMCVSVSHCHHSTLTQQRQIFSRLKKFCNLKRTTNGELKPPEYYV